MCLKENKAREYLNTYNINGKVVGDKAYIVDRDTFLWQYNGTVYKCVFVYVGNDLEQVEKFKKQNLCFKGCEWGLSARVHKNTLPPLYRSGNLAVSGKKRTFAMWKRT